MAKEVIIHASSTPPSHSYQFYHECEAKAMLKLYEKGFVIELEHHSEGGIYINEIPSFDCNGCGKELRRKVIQYLRACWPNAGFLRYAYGTFDEGKFPNMSGVQSILILSPPEWVRSLPSYNVEGIYDEPIDGMCFAKL